MYFQGKLAAVQNEFVERMHAIGLHTMEVPFDEALRKCRAIEAEFIARAGDDEGDILTTKRWIMWWVLASAISSSQSPDVCQEIWNEINRLGFMDMTHRHTISHVYARCCQSTGELETGLEVLKPLINELEPWHPQVSITPDERRLWEQQLKLHKELVAELEAEMRESPDSSPPSPSR